ncbi:MAG: 16S rRNA (cytosine(1402)-N(4))-methyltransferase [Candidatus Portnoybacteria bacterium RIFCSPLOWO2_01_FULL_43_11]|uniref:Ribosomal RNA small subunit methyltransferase H n=3 Tax=Candidatus Portnoyibacteriota TaxID=1817913 RepID=A0A1G2FD85_9BACT|nr:MAG: 16S rRNA (cytosine(1402)-N(4))-methyltransferase [Candidatus Portnoybacteria bacterium RIFCSPHIGHO2_01_FULL_40_12b]OGZ37308.1 MAG: 16S rRNA (cytosine(1402)-N(4))-methyltransferase [Candidatus Portnoybacteria bacterium RIFCSPHIGHO2_02_FULL_40_23]OGZ38473.1 MAG: 16S rRNA (cytosine(1402)-N(4))-methyltransferase [Candidatus Portnoybacteria bacterium RIFCSPLOWO2_01_FULL_43_11]OGZ38600.1 MAG: 16S rRNA (cytosine(1402)-N(4))-methyltransferase [Candidatus Portnoybacteria bacterium RIFCSPHIGHO2_12
MHQPVLLKEVLKYLDPKPNENFIDCTFGFGGHSLAVLERNKPKGKVLGIELDKKELLQSKLQERLTLVQGNFSDLKEIVEKNNFHSVSGILFDLGMSLWQIEKSERGFTFQKNEPLDMRFGDTRLRAEEIINNWPKEKLENIFREYGGERYAQRIAKNICQKRQRQKIRTTGELVKIIQEAVPRQYLYARIHFATRVFQALRIAVNDELNNLKKALPQALNILEPKGRIVVVSFHSLEDKIVKNFFRDKAKENVLKILTKKPIRPNLEEIKFNPRSRSAGLRAAAKS